MIGLEYVLQLANKEQKQLAEELGIRKQNINLWFKQKQNISKKYIPKLAYIFGIDEKYFQMELLPKDKLELEKVWLQAVMKKETDDDECWEIRNEIVDIDDRIDKLNAMQFIEEGHLEEIESLYPLVTTNEGKEAFYMCVAALEEYLQIKNKSEKLLGGKIRCGEYFLDGKAVEEISRILRGIELIKSNKETDKNS